MDIGMREILIGLGCIIMGVIFFDAYRRVRDQRRSQFGIRLDDSPVSSKAVPLSQVNQHQVSQESQVNHQVPSQLHSDPFAAMDSSAPAKPAGPKQFKVRIQTQKRPGAKPKSSVEQPPVDPLISDLTQREPEQSLLQPNLAHNPEAGDFYASRRQSLAARKAQETTRQQQALEEPKQSSSQSLNQDQEAPQQASPEEVIVMYVVAKEHETFVGEQLVHKLLSLEMRHGDMKIFHRYERPEQHDGLLFSMANLTKPGYFELDHMNAFETAGVAFFLSLPGPNRSLYAFDLMVETARKLSQMMDGELLDDQQSMITPQTVAHLRQKVIEFDRKQRMTEKVRLYRDRAGLLSD